MKNDRIQFAYDIVDVARLIRRVFDRRAMHLGLTRAQWRAMHRIERSPGLSQTQLAEDLDLEAIAVGRVVDRLVREGYVERRADPADRRRWNLYPAAKFDEMMGSILRIAGVLSDDLLGSVPREDLDATMRVLDKVKGTLLELDNAGRNGKR
jgi:MarR family transcriptional regulator, transcriptional regulator for hemolysin